MTHKTRSFLNYCMTGVCVAVLSATLTSYAMAQAPGSIEASPNAEAETVSENTDDATPPAAPAQNSATDPVVSTTSGTTTATSRSGLTADPCPEPKEALSSTPDDLAKIQEDITRFTLCVQRAQLLERLNELAEDNIETIDSALNLTVGGNNTDDGNAVPGIMPDMAMTGGNDAPPPPSNMANFDDLLDEPEESVSNSAPQAQSPAPRPRAASSSWEIRTITGSGGQMSAQLVDAQENIIRVSEGEDLPDDAGRISSLTRTGVTVQKDGETVPLRWVQP